MRMTDDRWGALVLQSTEWTQDEQCEVEAELTRARSLETTPQRALAPTEMDAIHMEANLDDARSDRNRARMVIARMRSYLGGDPAWDPIDLARHVNYEKRVAQEAVARLSAQALPLAGSGDGTNLENLKALVDGFSAVPHAESTLPGQKCLHCVCEVAQRELDAQTQLTQAAMGTLVESKIMAPGTMHTPLCLLAKEDCIASCSALRAALIAAGVGLK